MTTKLSSDLGGIIEQLQTLQNLYSQMEAELQGWKDRATKAEQLTGLADFAAATKIIEAAAAEGKSPQEWVAERLSEACEPNTDLTIDDTMYRRFQEIAAGRGISVRELSTGVDFTEILRDVFENMRL